MKKLKFNLSSFQEKHFFYSALIFCVLGIILVLIFVLSTQLYRAAGGSTAEWTFTTSTDFSYDDNIMEITGGIVRLISIDQTDDDNETKGFGGGTHSDTAFDVTVSVLKLDGTGLINGLGNFVSRVIDVGDPQSWTSFTWTPGRPYGKELPDSQSTESGYIDGNIDMTDNILLYHLNETSGDCADTSGNGIVGDSRKIVYNNDGKFSLGFGFNGVDGRIQIPTSTLINESGPYQHRTVALWFKPDDASGAKQVLFEEGNGTRGLNIYTDSGSLYVGGWNRTAGESGWKPGTFMSTTVSSGEWHHVALTLDVNTTTATSSNAFKAYLDGSEFGSGDGGALYAHAGKPMIGRSANTRFHDSTGGTEAYFNGFIDEFALWNRTLSATEMKHMYLRGALDLKFQVRSCDDGACDTEAFVGPGGSTSTYYSEEDGTTLSSPVTKILDSILDNRYFQYKAFLESSSSTVSPELKSISVSPSHFYAGGVSISNVVGQAYTTLDDFTETLGSGNQGNVFYQLSKNGTDFYFNTSSVWTLTTSTPDRNPASVIATNISTFNNVIGSSTLFFKAFLTSNGSEEVQLDTISLLYDNSIPAPATPPMSAGSGVLPILLLPPKEPESGLELLINNGEMLTTERIVLLSLNALEDAEGMAFSHSNDFDKGTILPYQNTIEWDLCPSDESCPDNTYTIFAKVFTASGQTSNILSDSIILSTTSTGDIVMKEIPSSTKKKITEDTKDKIPTNVPTKKTEAQEGRKVVPRVFPPRPVKTPQVPESNDFEAYERFVTQTLFYRPGMIGIPRRDITTMFSGSNMLQHIFPLFLFKTNPIIPALRLLQ
ncbi:MAG: LamG domain-containing protein [Candidatus Magasanikbacteria bacterium]